MRRKSSHQEAKNTHPIDYVEHVRTAWNYINHESNAAKYAAQDIEMIKASIINAAEKYGVALETV